MTIRPAKLADVESLIAMGRRFFEASGYSDITEFDAPSFGDTLRQQLTNESSVLLVVEKNQTLVGMAGAVVYPFYFNRSHLTAQEMFWWVDAEHRGVGAALFAAMREAVRAKGAKSLSMIALETLSPDRVGAFYEREGFRPSERLFIGRLH